MSLEAVRGLAEGPRPPVLSAATDGGVLLVSMPFGPPRKPALGLSLLKASLAGRPYRADVRYYNLEFSRRIGEEFYDAVCVGLHSNTEQLGEWLFSDPGPQDKQSYFERILHPRRGWSKAKEADETERKFFADVDDALAKVEDFLQYCLGDILRLRPRIVGFASVFQQNSASIALARRVKAAMPDCIVVMGGANCEGPMGQVLLDRFPFIDIVFGGEADLTFPKFCDDVLLAGGGAAGCGPRRQITSDVPVENLDALPIPDHSDFFEQRRQKDLALAFIEVPFETSRGCWWGQKHHCTFCGLNGSTMAFRRKSAPRAEREMRLLAARYPGHDLGAVDNILDMQYLRTLLPRLAAEPISSRIFYETKSNLGPEQVAVLARAGIKSIQPGIESLDTHVLDLMRKGVTGLQNIQLLKFCKAHAVHPFWNWLWGFPGEKPSAYEAQAGFLPKICHLPPPGGFGTVRLDRFSPNFTSAAQLGFRNLRPVPSYGEIYRGFDPADLERVAYYFDYDYIDHPDPAAYTKELQGALRRWQANHPSEELLALPVDNALVIIDLRRAYGAKFIGLMGGTRWCLLACDSIRSVAQMEESLPPSLTVAEMHAALQQLLDLGLVVREGDKYLSVAIAREEYVLGKPALDRLLEVLKALPGEGQHAAVALPDGPVTLADLRGSLVRHDALGNVTVGRDGLVRMLADKRQLETAAGR
jgi:ribosomal peptide maturation radical SAM protein 1